jgi:hypothetical protein
VEEKALTTKRRDIALAMFALMSCIAVCKSNSGDKRNKSKDKHEIAVPLKVYVLSYLGKTASEIKKVIGQHDERTPRGNRYTLTGNRGKALFTVSIDKLYSMGRCSAGAKQYPSGMGSYHTPCTRLYFNEGKCVFVIFKPGVAWSETKVPVGKAVLLKSILRKPLRALNTFSKSVQRLYTTETRTLSDLENPKKSGGVTNAALLQFKVKDKYTGYLKLVGSTALGSNLDNLERYYIVEVGFALKEVVK